MRPDETCVTRVQTLEPYALRVPGSRRPPCKYSYMEGINYKCGLIDIIKDNLPKTPNDLINEGIFTRNELFVFLEYCIRLILSNPEAVCIECGECCKMWADKTFCEHPELPCTPLDGTIKKPANPCTKLIKQGQIYKCAEYGSIPNCPDRIPDGTDIDFLISLLDGSLLICIDTPTQQIKMKTCPSCIYEFVREL